MGRLTSRRLTPRRCIIGTRSSSVAPCSRSPPGVPVAEVRLRIALLSYRSKPHCGGQGVYVRHLSRELAALGHDVEVFSGQPYPVLDPGVRLTEVPSLDLYREPDPFRTPRPARVSATASTCSRSRRCGPPASPSRAPSACAPPGCCATGLADFDVVHDNQTLGYGMLDDRAGRPPAGRPRSTTRSPSTAASTSRARPRWRKRLTLRRWYGFLRMQGKVARRLEPDPARLGVARRRDIVTRLRRRPGADRGDPARRRRGVPAADRAPGARPDRRDGQRGHPDEGHRDAARGVRQAAHRARRRAAAGQPADRRAARPSSSSTGSASATGALRARHHRRRARRRRGLGRDRLRAVALRGLLAADRRGDGLRDPAGRQPRRRDPRGGRARRRCAPTW